MKRISILLFALLSTTIVFGQEKKTIAVYVTGNCDGDIKKVVSSRVIAKIVRSREYAAVESTLDFDEALRREQNYQYSGNVDDGQVIKLGKQFGAGLVCVADAREKIEHYKRPNPHTYLFTLRLINIETGLVISFSIGVEYCDNLIKEYAKGCDGNSIILQESLVTIVDNLTTHLLQNVTTTAGKQKLAVYVTNSSDVFKAKTVSSRLTRNFTNSGTYAVVDRTSDFRVELSRQRSGRVDDGQIVQLGRQFGVNQVCVVDVLSSDYTAVRIINVETGIIVATAEAESWDIKAADKITRELMKQLVGCIKKDMQIQGNYVNCCEGLVNVNGVCRDLSGAAYWIDKSTCGVDFQVKYYNVGKMEWNKASAVCTSGWRLPSVKEMKCILQQKIPINIEGNWITNSLHDETHMNGKRKYTIEWYVDYVNSNGSVGKYLLKRIYYKGNGKVESEYEYKMGDGYYIRCVR
jgi:hypothetical protein